MKQYCGCPTCKEYMKYSRKTEAEFLEYLKNRKNKLHIYKKASNTSKYMLILVLLLSVVVLIYSVRKYG